MWRGLKILTEQYLETQVLNTVLCIMMTTYHKKRKKKETTDARASICLLVATAVNTVQYTG